MKPNDSAAFIDRLLSDEPLRQKFYQEKATPEAIIGWALAEGYQLTEEDFRNALSAKLPQDAKLSDDELRDISGGTDIGNFFADIWHSFLTAPLRPAIRV